ncbi:MAG: HlyD family efflux transporter periplasmic adaptor subunit [Deltaproteobacteria bacterium]|nr:HlyD family efflux transporter periplasmic adaptor subunit [Deltaproteobacteria bacterium]
MKRNVKLLYVVWAIAVVLVIILTHKYKSRGEFTDFYGIAETREIVVNSENPVEIKRILVVAGQEVQKEQLIVELASPELAKNINEIYHELDELKARAELNADALRSQINELKAKRISRVTEINYQLKQLQAQYAINRELTSELQSLEHDSGRTSNEHDGGNPIQIEMERLEKALELEINPLQIRINMLERKLNAPENPLEIQIQRLERELNMLMEEKNKLYIFALVTGIIGSVQCKAGEQISPFDSILTLHTKSPSYIKCFIHESGSANVSVGRKVTVTSLADPAYSVIGEVVGIGSRLVEYPRRLSRMLAVQTYGREVRVKIPEDNNLLLGEKVLVSVCDDVKQGSSGFAGSRISVSETHAREIVTSSDSGSDRCIRAISVSQSMKDISNIEPSGALYLKDIKKYLIISDTTRNHRPVLYLMDEHGNVEDWIPIRGLKEIDDMEAIAEDAEGNIYIACSQSHAGNGKITAARKLLLRLRRDKVFLYLDKKINLYDLLLDAAGRNRNTRWAQFIVGGGNDGEINIEGMFHRDGSLYLGFKRPLKDDKAVVLEISDIDMVFDKGRLDANSIKIWKEFALTDSAYDVATGISGLYPHKKNLYILSYANINKTGARQKVGNLWAYDVANDTLSHIKRFESLKPEGIAYNVDTDAFLITFDHGRRHPSQIMTWRP